MLPNVINLLASETANETDYKLIQEKLALLDPINRQIIELYYWEGKTLRDIAMSLGFKSQVTILNRLNKSYELLKRSLVSTATLPEPLPNTPQQVTERGNLL